MKKLLQNAVICWNRNFRRSNLALRSLAINSACSYKLKIYRTYLNRWRHGYFFVQLAFVADSKRKAYLLRSSYGRLKFYFEGVSAKRRLLVDGCGNFISKKRISTLCFVLLHFKLLLQCLSLQKQSGEFLRLSCLKNSVKNWKLVVERIQKKSSKLRLLELKRIELCGNIRIRHMQRTWDFVKHLFKDRSR